VTRGYYTVVLGGKRGAALQPGVAGAFRDAHPLSGTPAAAAAAAGEAAGGGGGAAARAAARDQVRAYAQGLAADHESVLATALGTAAADATATLLPAARVGAARLITHHFTVALNGFAAGPLTDAQAAALARSDGVLAVTPVRMMRAATFSTPTMLGLEGAGGVWETQFASASDAASDVLVGIIDTGARAAGGAGWGRVLWGGGRSAPPLGQANKRGSPAQRHRTRAAAARAPFAPP
jgi:hypothetical protein